MHKIIYGLVDLPFERHGAYNPEPLRRTRSWKPLQIKLPTSRTDLHLHSFFPRTTRYWNALPQAITDIDDPNIFKDSLLKHFE